MSDSQGRNPTAESIRLSTSQLIRITAIWTGIQASWAVQIGYATPALRHLGMPEKVLSYAWLAGPISGIIAQPIIGVLSDSTNTRWGRRAPWIVGGVIATATNLLLFAFADVLGGLWVAVIAFWALDFSINGVQAPSRALMVDLVGSEQQTQVQSATAAWVGLGQAAGYVMGSWDVVGWAPWVGSNLIALYTATALFFIITASITLSYGEPSAASESDASPLLKSDGDDNAAEKGQKGSSDGTALSLSTTTKALNKESMWSTLVRGMFDMPSPIARAFLTQSATYFAWFATFMYTSDWVGSEVYGGDPEGTAQEQELYDEGVRTSNKGLALMSLLSLFLSPTLPWLCTTFGLRTIWGSALGIFGVLLISMQWVSTPGMAVTVITGLGFALAVSQSLPWVIVANSAAKVNGGRDKALYTSLFNLSQCLPEVLLALIGGPIIKAAGSISFVLMLGGFGALFGAVSTAWLLVPDEETSKR